MKLINLKREAQTSDKLIAVSEATKLDLIKFFQVPENKIEVVYNGVDEKYFIEPPRKLASEVRQKFALPAKYILFIGTIEPRKNLVTLIKAYRYMRDKWKVDMELVLAGGEGWQNHLRDVNEAIKEQKLTKKVKYLGRVSEDEKYALLHGASLLVYPSWYEGFGLPPLEAMAAGVPVVASNVSSIPEIVGDAALLADPADPEAIGKGMAQLILQTKLANSLKMQGKLQAHKFTWEKAAEKVYAILKGK
jgi:glycosyltransferase involved in cell wall biosynthesis